MSVDKRFHITCDSVELLIDREYSAGKSFEEIEANMPQRQETYKDCVFVGPAAYSLKDARAKAKEAGWVRLREKHASSRTTMYDLCPGCAPKVRDLRERQVAEAVLLS